MKKKIYLVDVSSMFFRAFYAIRPLSSPSGLPVNAIYGFLSMLTKLLKEEHPEFVVFCYDRKEPSFRKDLYTEYKANRTEMPEDLAKQIPYIKKLADVLGIPSLEVPRYEADDLIGTLAHRAKSEDFDALIISGDKDFGQLVGDGVILYDTMKDVKYDPAGVKEKWGVPPEQMIDYLAICGDTSDNIPGVAGIGPKGAIKLLEQFKTLEGIYAGLDQISSASVRDKLLKSKAEAFLAKRLVTIETQVPIAGSLEDFHVKPMDRAGVQALMQELNFKSFEKTLLESAEGSTFSRAMSATATGSTAVSAARAAGTSAEQPIEGPVNEFVDDGTVRTFEVLTPDNLARRLPGGGEVWGLHDERGVFIAVGREIFGVEGDPRALGPLLERKDLRWAGFDLKTFWHLIGAVRPRGAWDAMLAAYAVDAGDRTELAKVVRTHLGVEAVGLDSPSSALAIQEQLREVLTAKLKERAAEKIFEELEMPLAPVLLEMERQGIRIDVEALVEQGKELEIEIAALEKEVHREAGESFSVGSPKQLGVILFEKLGLPTGKKTKTGYSTDSDVLAKLDHPIAQKVLQWRELSKLKSTYVDALPQACDEHGRIHTHFNQALAATGRLSSTSPNLQNIPIRTERGQRVRRAFIAAPGRLLLSADYSQIELRVLAHISGDPGLTSAFENDLDIHTATAAEVFSVGLKDVTPEHRRRAKAVNFGIAYGQGAFGLAEVLGIPRGEAQEIIKHYFEKFKGVKEYIESTTKTAHEKGYVETLFGRRRYLPELQQKNPMLRKFGERAAINAPIQGTASDLVKKAMIEIAAKVPVPMLLQVHDELIFEGTKDELHEWSPRIIGIMENVVRLKVPLRANHAIGPNWDEAH